MPQPPGAPETGDEQFLLQLDQDKLPRRVDLELSAAAFRQLLQLSAASGRSISEVAAELIGDRLGEEIRES